MKNGWMEFLERAETHVASARSAVQSKAAPPTETAAEIRQGTLRALLLLSERPITPDEARECAQQIAQLRRSLLQAETAFRRRAGESV